MKVFVTGGTGFIGKHVIDQLLARGDQVVALVRSGQDAEKMRRRGGVPARGNITDRASMEPAMRGSDLVFHIAAWYKVGTPNQEQAERVNVEGTRQVLELALELGIPRIIYTSTVGVFGDTHGQLVDENYRMPAGQSFVTEYERTKWKAHYEVALPLIERGAPVIIVMPGGVYGPGDTSLIGEMLRWFYRGWLPVLPGPDTAFTFAHVEDIARGHLLAAEHGKLGESYIIAGPALTLREFFRIAAAVSSRPAPLAEIPGRVLVPLAPLIEKAANIFPLPGILSRDALMTLDTTYIAQSNKAHTDLGWGVRDVRDGLSETLDWIAGQTPAPLIPVTRRKQIAGLAVAASLAGFISWLFLRRR